MLDTFEIRFGFTGCLRRSVQRRFDIRQPKRREWRRDPAVRLPLPSSVRACVVDFVWLGRAHFAPGTNYQPAFARLCVPQLGHKGWTPTEHRDGDVPDA